MRVADNRWSIGFSCYSYEFDIVELKLFMLLVVIHPPSFSVYDGSKGVDKEYN